MPSKLRHLLLLFGATGLIIVAWQMFRTSADGAPTAQASDAPSKGPNLSLWVPEEELKVWDPVNPNVNPVPWRVFGPMDDEGKRTAAFRHTSIDKRVRVEGFAWGYEVKTELPTSRVVFEGGTVLVYGVDFNKPEVRGKCVRVVGTLRLKTMSPPRFRGFNRQFPNYYCIDAESFEIIEQIVDPKVVLDPEEKDS